MEIHATGNDKLNLDGSNADRSIDIGSEDFTTEGLGTFGELDVDDINIDGNVITSSDVTGTISFDNDNLVTSGYGSFDSGLLIASDITGLALGAEGEVIIYSADVGHVGIATASGSDDLALHFETTDSNDGSITWLGATQVFSFGAFGISAGAVTIDQAADGVGLQINGFDDESGSSIKQYVDSNGVCYLETVTGLLFLRPRGANVSFLSATALAMFNDKDFLLGQSGTNHTIFRWSTAQTNDSALIGLDDAGSRTLIICDKGDKAFDFQHGVQATPTVFIHSAAQSLTQWISLAHDGTDGIIATGAGDLNLAPAGNITIPDATFPVLDKASGNGIKVDTTNPTFGWADLQGIVTNSKGANKPTEATYRGSITEFRFSDGDDVEIDYHIPHDHVPGTDIHLHVHWSHIGDQVTGGTLTFTVESSYAKGHNQAVFSAPVTGTFTGTASTTQYQHIVSETQYSASTPTGLQVDTDDLEPDGIILMRFEMTTNNITVSGGLVPDPFIHHIDIHYQTTGLIGTKAKAPDFYA